MAQIAHVDPVDVVARLRRTEHVAAALETLDPVGESIRVVARANDVGRPHDRSRFAIDLLHDAIAFGLERTVGLAGDLFD